MNLHLSMALRPSSFVILQAYAALIVLISLTPCWYAMVTHMEKRVNLNKENFVSQLQSEIEYTAELLHPMKSSSTNLARILNSTLDATNISFSDVKTKVAPLLFQAFQTIPYIAQISFIGMEGLFFSYYTDHEQAVAVYSNSSPSTRGNLSNTTLYYIQPVNRESGEVYGEPIISNNLSMNPSWLYETVNHSYGYDASLGTQLSNGHDLLFLSSARITSKGAISLGFSATAITDFVTRIISKQGTSLYLVTKDGKVLVEGIQHTRLVISNDTVSFQSVNANGDLISNEGTVSCKDEAVTSSLKIRDTEYLIHCNTIDIMGIESVYVLAVPRNRLVSFDLNYYKKKGLTLMIVMMGVIIIAMLSFLFLNGRASRREMHLCASLIKQMEATQQAEQKNMNKSLALASVSHDVRTSLAGLTGLIEMSHELLVPGSELATNLKQMDGCTQDLLGLLNSILDTSKIEAGKMQLEEEEFDLFRLLEDVVDLFYPLAMKKGVDLVLDPCNGSIIRYSRVKGDTGKLKQVLCNLLSNAVKFTDEGHIAVRAKAQKPRFQNSIMATNQYSFTERLACLFYKKNEARDDIEAAMTTSNIQQDPYSIDFTFEVDDTGKGIPKEKYKSVFENYVQVKETALGQGGTGLGLGIVQSLVRLMHGDIEIVDKDIGEKGTCFRFNVLFSVCETVRNGSTREDPHECESGDKNQAQELTSSGSSICSLSPRLHNICSSSPRPEASCVILLISDKERRRTSQKFMQNLGIKVKVVKRWQDLWYTLDKIKREGRYSSSHSSPGSSNLSSSHSSFARSTKRVPLSAMEEGTHDQYIPSVFKKTDIGAGPGFILIIIDANAGPFPELYKFVTIFRKYLRNPCKVVWLDKPLVHGISSKTLNRDKLDPNDIVISKPLHGSRLFQVIKLLPEYGGTWQSGSSSRAKRESVNDHRDGENCRDHSSCLSKYKYPMMDNRSQLSSSTNGFSFPRVEQHSLEDQSYGRWSKARKYQERGDSSCNKPLRDKKFLVVDDSACLRIIACRTLDKLGATVERCENGEEAVRLIAEGLTRDFRNPPYDYILMDHLMPPGMNGIETTEEIRKIEKPHGLRIPIIALTASDNMTTEDGMDYHLLKPINPEGVLKAIRYIDAKE